MAALLTAAIAFDVGAVLSGLAAILVAVQAWRKTRKTRPELDAAHIGNLDLIIERQVSEIGRLYRQIDRLEDELEEERQERRRERVEFGRRLAELERRLGDVDGGGSVVPGA